MSGPRTHSLLRMIPVGYRRCEIFEKCLNAMASDCHPCATLPDCYDPPGLGGMPERMIAAAVALSWRDSVYVLVPEGAEFSL